MPDEKQKFCFVIMPFNKERMEVYKSGIEPACQKAGFKTTRVDELIGPHNINDKIMEHIFNSDAIIAEITDKNPNVYYELGVAHAISNKTLMIAQNDDLPFDIRNYRCLIYTQSEEGLAKLQKQIVDSLLALETWSQYPNNPVRDFKSDLTLVSKSVLEEQSRELQKKEELLRGSVPKADREKLQRQVQNLQNELRVLEQRLSNTVAKTELEAMQRKLAQQTAENARLEQELQRWRLQAAAPSQPGSSRSKVYPRLRSEPMDNLSGKEVKAMLRRHEFYCRETESSKDWSNPQGRGIANNFELQQNGEVVVDFATGLTWQQFGSPDSLTYADAEKHVRDLKKQRFAGYNDWRLSTLEEAMSLMEREERDSGLHLNPVFGQTQQAIWTSDKKNAGAAWMVSFYDGDCNYHDVDANRHYVRAVR